MIDNKNIDDQMHDLFKTVPLGMSKFQVGQFVVNKNNPTRSYRQAVMELHKRYDALKQAENRRKKYDAELSLMKKRIKWWTSWEKKALVNAEIDEKLHQIRMEESLIDDAIIHVRQLMGILSGFPKFTREEIEEGEQQYWTTELTLQAKRDMLATGRVSAGTLESLERLNMSPTQVTYGIELGIKRDMEAIKQLEAAKTAGAPPDDQNDVK